MIRIHRPAPRYLGCIVRIALVAATVTWLDVSVAARRAQACPDGDGDGICDADDPCTRAPLTVVEHPRLKLGRLDTPPGDDTLSFRANIAALPNAGTDNYPPVDGVRVLLETAAQATVLDATIPGGAYDATTRVGWKVSHHLAALFDRLTYINRSGAAIGGIERISIFRKLNNGSVYRVSVLGRKGSYPIS